MKGLKLTKLPQILTIQLSRFTLDWTTFQMVKVHDKVTFPFILNGNNYLHGFEGIKNPVSNTVLSNNNKGERQSFEPRPPGVAFSVDLNQGSNNSAPVKDKGPTDADVAMSDMTTRAGTAVEEASVSEETKAEERNQLV